MSQVEQNVTNDVDETQPKLSGQAKQRIVLGISALIFAASAVSVYVQDSSRNEAIASGAAQIAAMEQEKNQYESQLSAIKTTVDSDVLSLDPETVERDREMIEDILSKALTWDSADSYDTQRLDIINTYKITGESQFTSVFMPEPKCASDSAGRYCSIDLSGLVSQYQSSRISVSEIGIGYYSYTAEYVATTESNDGTASVETRGIMNIKISSIGTVESIWAIPSSGNVLTSQP